MEFNRGTLLLYEDDCRYIINKRDKNELYDVFEEFVKKNNSKLDIKRINTIQAGGNNFKLSLELMQCVRDRFNK